MQHIAAIPHLMPLIMAGGTGTRLWPLSRKLYPKQFQFIHPAGCTPFQAALRLAGRLAEPQRVQIVTAYEQRFLATRQAAAEAFGAPVWTEPCRCSTAAVAALATDLLQRPDEILLLMPSDQYIADTAAATEAFRKAARLAQAGRLVLFGVKPTAPETGFGYIEIGRAAANGGREVLTFHEKPDRQTALQFLQSGRHLWNSGLFMMRADTLSAQLRQLAPEILTKVQQARRAATMDGDGLFAHLPMAQWQAVPEESFDRAVVEKSDILSVVDFDVGWSDLGTFDALWQAGEADQHNNVEVGEVMAVDTSGSFLHAHAGRLLAVMGVRDMTVVDSGDAVLVAPRSQSQQMRQVVAEITSRNDNDAVLNSHVQVHRPWGSYITLDAGETHLCKRIIVNPGASLSLQRHQHRSEHWVIVRGEAEVRLGERTMRVKPNESVYVAKGEVHCLHNPGAEELELIEVQTGDTLSEDDIERLEDDYGRAVGRPVPKKPQQGAKQ